MQKQIQNDQQFNVKKENSQAEQVMLKVQWHDTYWGEMLVWVVAPFLIMFGLLAIPGVDMMELLLGLCAIGLLVFFILMLWAVIKSIKTHFSQEGDRRRG